MSTIVSTALENDIGDRINDMLVTHECMIKPAENAELDKKYVN